MNWVSSIHIYTIPLSVGGASDSKAAVVFLDNKLGGLIKVCKRAGLQLTVRLNDFKCRNDVLFAIP